ncbi:MAG: hypothetical protein OCC49_16000 [Fibrobacterales bacterium]
MNNLLLICLNLSICLYLALLTSCSEANPAMPAEVSSHAQVAVPTSSAVTISSSSAQLSSSSIAPIANPSMETLMLYYTDTVTSTNGDYYSRYFYKIPLDLDSYLRTGVLDSATHASHTIWLENNDCDTYMRYFETIDDQGYVYCRHGSSRETMPTDSGIYISETEWQFGCRLGDSKYFTESDTLYTHYIGHHNDCRSDYTSSSFRVLNNTDTIEYQDSTGLKWSVDGTLKKGSRSAIGFSWEVDLLTQDTITRTHSAIGSLSWTTLDSIRTFEYRLDSNTIEYFHINLSTNDTILYEKKVNGEKEGVCYYQKSELVALNAYISLTVYETYGSGVLNGRRWATKVNREFYFEEHYIDGLFHGEVWYSALNGGYWNKTLYTYAAGLKEGPFFRTLNGDTLLYGTFQNNQKNGTFYKKEETHPGFTYQYLTHYTADIKEGPAYVMNALGDTLKYQHYSNDTLLAPAILPTEQFPTINNLKITNPSNDTITQWKFIDSTYTSQQIKIIRNDSLFAYTFSGSIYAADFRRIVGKSLMIETGAIGDIAVIGAINQSSRYKSTVLAIDYDSLDRIEHIYYQHSSYSDPSAPVVNSFDATVNSDGDVSRMNFRAKDGNFNEHTLCISVATCSTQDAHYLNIISDAKQIPFIDVSTIPFSGEWNKVVSWKP